MDNNKLVNSWIDAKLDGRISSELFLIAYGSSNLKDKFEELKNSSNIFYKLWKWLSNKRSQFKCKQKKCIFIENFSLTHLIF